MARPQAADNKGLWIVVAGLFLAIALIFIFSSAYADESDIALDHPAGEDVAVAKTQQKS